MADAKFDLSKLFPSGGTSLIQHTPALLKYLNSNEYQFILALFFSDILNDDPTMSGALKFLPQVSKSAVIKTISNLLSNGVLTKASGNSTLSENSFKTSTVLVLNPVNDSHWNQRSPQKGKESQPDSEPTPQRKKPMEPIKRHKVQEVTENVGAIYTKDKESSSGEREDFSDESEKSVQSTIPKREKASSTIGLDMKWLERLNSSDPKIRELAVKQVGALYGAMYKRLRGELAPGLDKFFVPPSMHKTFADIAKMCKERDVNFADYVRYCHRWLTSFKSGLSFPAPKNLKSEDTLARFLNRDKQGELTIQSDGFRADLKNASLPGTLSDEGFDLTTDQIKYVESIARQRKLGVQVECEPDLETAVQHTMKHGCPDL